MLDKLDQEFAFGREALDVRAYRQELLSSNIANADTPGYKARDVDFASALAGALSQATRRVQIAAGITHPYLRHPMVLASMGQTVAVQ